MDITVAPIKLKYAIAQSVEVAGSNIAYTYVKVKVKNLGSQTDVEFIYKNSDGVWHSIPLPLEADYGDYDIYESINAPYTEEFALKSIVDQLDHWDSNYGMNYKLSSNNDNVIGGNIILNKATVKTSNTESGNESASFSIEGEIYTRKISFNKRIGIRLSGDDGESWEETDAIYQGVEIEGAYDNIFNTPIEVWKFKTPARNYPAKPDFIRFAIYYKNEQTGESYWDNNFEQDYKLNKINGATIE